MNDEIKRSSSQQMNTTHFKNRNILVNNNKVTGFNGVRPRNNNINNNPDNRILDNNRDLLTKKDANDVNLTEEEKKQKASDYVNQINKGRDTNIPNRFGPKNRLNNSVNKLRDALNTNPNLKDDAVKKGAEALKKSTNPYAKAAGYATSYLQKRKEKKQEKEDKGKEEKQDNNEDNYNDNNEKTTTSEKRSVVIKKLLPILMLFGPILAILLIIITIFAPIIEGYSWFYSIFNHNTDDAESYYIYNKNDEKKLQQEIEFNEAIVGSRDGSRKGIIGEYQEKYGVTLDRNLLIAIITYRYTVIDSDNLYTSDGTEDLIDEEINENIDNIENNSNVDTEENNAVNYTEAKKKIKTVANLMLINNGGSYSTDNKVGGEVYNKLINSSFLTSYYKKQLINNEYETRKKLVDEIFEYAEGARDLFDEQQEQPINGGVIGDTSVIHLQTCSQPYSYKKINNTTVYNNPAWNEGTSYLDYLNAKDYIKGVIFSEIGISNDYREAMKAQAIAALTYLINDSNSGFNLKSGEMYFPSGTCRQATCSPTDGCTSVSVKNTNLHTFYVGQNRFPEGTNHAPLSEANNNILEEVLNEVFGKIMVKKGITSATFSGSNDTVYTGYLNKCDAGNCFSQVDAQIDARNGKNYVEILAKYYSNLSYDIIDIREGLYIQSSSDNYSGTVNLNNNFHYHQSDYPWGSENLCDSGSISGNGCNITSAAIAISLLKNEGITPKVLNDRQNEIKTCKQSSRSLMIMDFAKLYGLNPIRIDKANQNAVNDMLKKLSMGNYVAIARLGSNSGRYSTSNGHYIALVGAKVENGINKVLVWDPAYKTSSRDNYWADVNIDLLPHLRADYSFILIGR